MNRTSAKRGFKALLAMFLLVGGMLFFTNSVSAQSATPTAIDLSGIMWMTEAEALDVINTTITTTHQQIDQALPGSPLYLAGIRRVVFLKGVYSEISSNTTVPDAISKTFDLHDNNGVYASEPGTTYTFQQALDEANYTIALLRTN